MLALLLFACAPDGTPLDEAWAPDAQEVLYDDVQQDILERTRVAAVGSLRWQPDGPELPTEARQLSWPLELPVVDAGARVGVIDHTRRTRLRLYLDRSDLVPSVWGWSEARAHPDRAAAPGHMLVPPGHMLTVLDRRGGWAEVELELEDQPALWLPSDRLDPVYDPSQEAPLWEAARPEQDWEPVAVAAGSWLLDAPRGEALAVHEADGPLDGWTAWAVGPEQDAHRPVVLRQAAGSLVPELRAWAHTDDLSPGGIGMWGVGCGGCGGSGWGSHPTPDLLPAGSWLRDGPAGEVVGRTRESIEVFWNQEDWQAFTEWSRWGELELWFDTADLVANPRWDRAG
jgi:hypothetical protein